MRVTAKGQLVIILLLGALAACDERSNNTAVNQPPLGLPPLASTADNPPTPTQIALGKKLFFDRRLSFNNTISCAMCHVPEQGFTANELATAVGMEGRSLRRNAPTIFNVAYHPRLFHDGREATLENQAWGPLLTANEMANPSIGHVIEKIGSLQDYDSLFETAFPQRGLSTETIGQALAGYERSIVSANSRFDRWHYAKEENALNENEKQGYRLFAGKARCVACHTIGDKHALFSDFGFHNSGIGWQRSLGTPPKIRVELIPGLVTEIERKQFESIAEPEQNDVGRFEITLNPQDRWAYKTPSLRNIALTAPYMHDGSLPTLEAAVDFYDRGGIDNPGKSALLQPLGLNAQEKQALVAFLKALTGDNVERLVQDARSAGIGQ